MLPMGLGYVEGVTHDYKRHGTTTLFAALNVLNGAVLATCKPRHRHQEFLSFLREIDKAVPAELDVHCIADNYATHSHPKIKAWLAARPRWHMHFIPTYSSWLNQVERFFSLITDKVIRRGSFTSVKQLVQRIDHFVAAYNTNCQPFKWTATADSIPEKLHRLCSRITGTGHYGPTRALAVILRRLYRPRSAPIVPTIGLSRVRKSTHKMPRHHRAS
jgi:putative transposase